MLFTQLAIPGCYSIEARVFQDVRGQFVKPFVASALKERGLRSDFVEQYYSTSSVNVIRGMHFQTPPCDHAKLVYCASGAVRDVLLDVRSESLMYGKSLSLELSSENGMAIYIPSGVAHGFTALVEPALLVYNVTSEYSPPNDTGIRWDSFGFDWGIEDPIMSERDRMFTEMNAFVSPFR